MKTKKLRNVGKSKSTDTEEEDVEEEENLDGGEAGEDGKKHSSFKVDSTIHRYLLLRTSIILYTSINKLSFIKKKNLMERSVLPKAL